jgi:hypothetical protein
MQIDTDKFSEGDIHRIATALEVPTGDPMMVIPGIKAKVAEMGLDDAVAVLGFLPGYLIRSALIDQA